MQFARSHSLFPRHPIVLVLRCSQLLIEAIQCYRPWLVVMKMMKIIGVIHEYCLLVYSNLSSFLIRHNLFKFPPAMDVSGQESSLCKYVRHMEKAKALRALSGSVDVYVCWRMSSVTNFFKCIKHALFDFVLVNTCSNRSVEDTSVVEIANYLFLSHLCQNY